MVCLTQSGVYILVGVVTLCMLTAGKSELQHLCMIHNVHILTLSLPPSFFRFIDNKKQEHNLRHYFFPVPGHTILWGDGEYLCPLCQTYGNTVLPLATPLHFTALCARPERSLTLDECQSFISSAVMRGMEITSNVTGTTCTVHVFIVVVFGHVIVM